METVSREAFEHLVLRYSALEWIVETFFANEMARIGADDADHFLTDLASPYRRPYTSKPGHEITPESEEAMLGYIEHIAFKIRERANGIRQL